MHPVTDLDAYQVAAAVANDVFALVRRWSWFEQSTVGVQLVRALDSIAANIAESCGRSQVKDRRRFLFIARGSYLEAEHWLRQAEARGLIESGWRQQLETAGRALNGMIKHDGRRTNTNTNYSAA